MIKNIVKGFLASALIAVIGITSVAPAQAASESVCHETGRDFSYCAYKSVDKKVAKKGDILNYTLTVTNTGNARYDSIIVSDQLPSGVEYIAGSSVAKKGSLAAQSIRDNWFNGGGTAFNAGTLNPGSTLTITFKVKVTQDVVNGQMLENVGMFTAGTTAEETAQLVESGEWNWKYCAARTTVVVDVVPTPTPTATPTVAPTKTPEVLPATGPGTAMAVVLGGFVVTLMGRKFFMS